MEEDNGERHVRTDGPSSKLPWALVRGCAASLEDIEKQPVQWIAFTDAVAFFTRSGVWAESRMMIGDFLELHRDALEAIGRRFIDARRSRELGETRRSSAYEPCDSPLKLARLVARRQSGNHPGVQPMPAPRSRPVGGTAKAAVDAEVN
jgi:hypothetical protein